MIPTIKTIVALTLSMARRHGAVGLTALTLGAVSAARADTHYVNIANPTPQTPFDNWTAAATNIQQALDVASAGDTVLVTNGLYNVGGISNWPAGGQLTNRVAVTNAIIVLAASTNPADTVIAGAPDPVTGSNGNAAVRGVYLAANAQLSGFTVSNGYGRLWGTNCPDSRGGGICAANISSIISNCLVIDNCAHYAGGIYHGSAVDCRIAYNTSRYGGGKAEGSAVNCLLVTNRSYWVGGGAYLGTFRNCTIVSNCASDGGGLYYSTAQNCAILANYAVSEGGGCKGTAYTNCVIIGNRCAGVGGGVWKGHLQNCLVVSNTAGAASGGGGGVYGGAGWTLLNCTLAHNSAAGNGGGLAGGGALTNCIVYFNSPQDFFNANYAADYCCTSSTNSFTNLVSGVHNLTNAPVFAGAGDYHLAPDSPGLDAGLDLPGAVTNDLDGVTRPQDGDIGLGAHWDLGCYEYFIEGTVLLFH